MKKTLFKALGLYLLMLIFFVLSLVCIQIIPRNAIEKNVLSSSKLLQEEGDYPYKFRDQPVFYLDNYTDALMHNITVSSETCRPVDAAMMCYYYSSYTWPEGVNLEKTVSHHSEGLSKKIYGRYWQGYQIVLRPLLCFFDLRDIRHINWVLMSFMFGCCLFLVGRRISWIESLLLLFSLLAVNIVIVPFSLQYSNCFYQMLVYTIILLICPRLTSSPGRLALTFFVIGGLTAFFDFLTTPQITLGIPLILTILVYHFDRPYLCTIKASISWVMGYALLWASKWVVGYWLTGFDFWANASHAAQERLSSSIGDTEITLSYIFEVKVSTVESYFWSVFLLLVLGIVLWNLVRLKGRHRLIEHSWLLLIALIVPVWYVVLLNHSFEHFWFTRRALLVSMFALFVWIRKMLFYRH